MSWLDVMRSEAHPHDHPSRSRDHSMCAFLLCPSIKPLTTSPVLGSLEARRLMKRHVWRRRDRRLWMQWIASSRQPGAHRRPPCRTQQRRTPGSTPGSSCPSCCPARRLQRPLHSSISTWHGRVAMRRRMRSRRMQPWARMRWRPRSRTAAFLARRRTRTLPGPRSPPGGAALMVRCLPWCWDRPLHCVAAGRLSPEAIVKCRSTVCSLPSGYQPHPE
jgi:hypothetical protein